MQSFLLVFHGLLKKLHKVHIFIHGACVSAATAVSREFSQQRLHRSYTSTNTHLATVVASSGFRGSEIEVRNFDAVSRCVSDNKLQQSIHDIQAENVNFHIVISKFQ